MSFMTNLSKAYNVHRRKILVAGALTTLGLLQYTSLNPLAFLFRTPGVQNIENRFSAGGGTKTHVPGAATKRGDSDQVESRAKGGGNQGIGSDKFREEVGGQHGAPSGFDKAWNEMNYGKDKGK